MQIVLILILIVLLLLLCSTTLALRGESGDGIFWKALSSLLAIFFGSILVGMTFGIITAYVMKNRERHENESESNTEMTILFLIPWVSYLIAEVLMT